MIVNDHPSNPNSHPFPAFSTSKSFPGEDSEKGGHQGAVHRKLWRAQTLGSAAQEAFTAGHGGGHDEMLRFNRLNPKKIGNGI